jgi:hypothetical protein
MKSFKDFLNEGDTGFVIEEGRIHLIEEAFRSQDVGKAMGLFKKQLDKITGKKFGYSSLPAIYNKNGSLTSGYYFFPSDLQYALRLNMTENPAKAKASASEVGGKSSVSFDSLDYIKPNSDVPVATIEFKGMNIIQILDQVKSFFSNPTSWIGKEMAFAPAYVDGAEKIAAPTISKEIAVIEESVKTGLVEEKKFTIFGITYNKAQDAINSLIEQGYSKEALLDLTDENGTEVFTAGNVKYFYAQYIKANGSVTGVAGVADTASTDAATGKVNNYPKIPEKIPVKDLFQYLDDLSQMVIGKHPKDESKIIIPKDGWHASHGAIRVYDVNGKWQHMKDDPNIYIPGTLKMLLVAGQGGTGKTFGIEQIIAKEGLKKGVDFIANTGAVSPSVAFKSLYDMRFGGLLLFDDCDDFLNDSAGQNIIKGALDSKEVREITWGKATPGLFKVLNSMYIDASEYEALIPNIYMEDGSTRPSTKQITHNKQMINAAKKSRVIDETNEHYQALMYGQQWWFDHYFTVTEGETPKDTIYVHNNKDRMSKVQLPGDTALYNKFNNLAEGGAMTAPQMKAFIKNLKIDPGSKQPDTFLFDGRMIFVSNMDLAKAVKSPHIAAITSRGAGIAVNLDAADLVARIEMINEGGGFDKVKNKAALTDEGLELILEDFRRSRDENPADMSGALNIRAFNNAVIAQGSAEIFGLKSDAGKINKLFFGGDQWR